MSRSGKSLSWNRALFVATALLLLALSISVPSLAQNNNPAILMSLNDGVTPLSVLQNHPSCIDFKRVASGLYRVHIQQNVSIYSALNELNNDSGVSYAEIDAKIAMPEEASALLMMSFDINSDPTLYVSQSAYPQVDLGMLSGAAPINGLSSLAGAPYTTITVAVLDTGVLLTHPALQSRLVTGYNVIDPTSDPSEIQDGTTSGAYGHGTMIAGIIARTSPHAAIMPIRVLNADGYGSVADIITGIQYAVNNGAQVINMSFSNTYRSQALKDALQAARSAGVVLVAAAGNDSSSALHYPAAFPGVIGVASVNSNNVLSSFSNYGSYVDVCAPGEQIRSTFVTGGYATWTGTSFATAFVTAEAAEIAVRHPNWSSYRISNRIHNTANSINSQNPNYGGQLGAGLIDVLAAVFGDD